MKKPKLFISYSRPDEIFKAQLEKHLVTMKRNGEVELWNDRLINPGEEWEKKINTELLSADVILLLVSADFLSSDYCNDVEVSAAMTKYQLGQAKIIPIILRPCDWNSTSFGKIQALPQDGKPVSSWSDKDEAYLSIVQGIKKALGTINQDRNQKHDNLLEDYPVYPMVKPEDVPLSIIVAISNTVRRSEAEMIISEANRLRKSVNPNDKNVTIIQLNMLPDPDHATPYVFWIKAVGEARLNGPRMLASLLLTIPDYPFTEEVKAQKTDLLIKLKTYGK